VANLVAGAGRHAAAAGRIVNLGFVYPDAIDIRTTLPCGDSHAPVRGPASRADGARTLVSTEPGTPNESPASHPQTRSAEGERSSVGGAP